MISLKFNPKSIVYIFGGAILGFMLFESLEAALIVGIIGAIVSFLR